MRYRAVFTVMTILIAGTLPAHDDAIEPPVPDAERLIEFPDTEQYLTLSVDLHTHSVFSDGHVWPRTRVEEALRDGLDALAITEHLEWQPHRIDILNPDRNRAYEIARDAARSTDLIVISGSEITREMPVGHINAVFLDDANTLFVENETAMATTDADEYYDATGLWSASDALASARDQGAFVFWNHPDYVDQAPDGIARPTDFHLAAIANQEIQGIEIANGDGYSEEAFDIALEHNLTLIGVSDIHELIDWDYEPHKGGHRPVTLVLATERSSAAIREALLARRTVVWFKNQLMGREEHLAALLYASLVPTRAYYVTGTDTAMVRFENRSDARLLLINDTNLSFMNSGDLIEVPPHDTLDLHVKTIDRLGEIPLTFRIANALVSPKQAARMTFRIPVDLAEAASEDR